MFRKPAVLVAMVLGSTAHLVHAVDDRVLAYFEETCGACHGTKGQGTPGLAPPLKGSSFVMQADPAEISAVITKGRAGEQKKFPSLASPMPAHSMSDGRLKAIVAYLRDELQK